LLFLCALLIIVYLATIRRKNPLSVHFHIPLAFSPKNTEYFAIGLVHHSFSEVLHIIAKKIKKISQTVQPNHSEAPVSEKMWIDIEVLMMEVYPSSYNPCLPSQFNFFRTRKRVRSTEVGIIFKRIDIAVESSLNNVRKQRCISDGDKPASFSTFITLG